MSDDVTLKRIEIIEARVSAPILDAIEGFRRDTLAMFESTKTEIVGTLKREMADSEKRLAAAIAKQTTQK